MPTIHFKSLNQSIEVPDGTSILKAAGQAGILIESPCNANGTCGKCKILLDQTSRSHIVEDGAHHLSIEERERGYVLSCQAFVHGDVSVLTVPQKNTDRSLKIVSQGKALEIALEAAIQKDYCSKSQSTLVYAGNRLLGVEPGDTRQRKYGLVVDIGTTTLVTSLIDLSNGEELGSESALNPQALHAQDVLSRIRFASDEQGLQTLYQELINEINQMIRVLSKENQISSDWIYEVVFSGNTCMLHLATGAYPTSLGKYPYQPLVTGGEHTSAIQHGLSISRFGLIYLPPIIAPYVGADITSGVLASQLAELPGATLFVDIGTNGEIVLAKDGKLYAASTAAGPAFEGMNITCGMRAGRGAVEYFEVKPEGDPEIRTIGDTKPVGICGSGLLDLVAELVAQGAIDSKGKLAKEDNESVIPSLRKQIQKREGKPVFLITDDVFLTQKDIRQVQLAKGAIRAGIEALLRSIGLKAFEIDRVQIAGSFGYHLRAKSLVNLGLLPKEFEHKIEFLGNTSQSGGKAFLLNQSSRKQMENLVKQIETLELANSEGFDQLFVEALGFQSS